MRGRVASCSERLVAQNIASIATVVRLTTVTAVFVCRNCGLVAVAIIKTGEIAAILNRRQRMTVPSGRLDTGRGERAPAHWQ